MKNIKFLILILIAIPYALQATPASGKQLFNDNWKFFRIDSFAINESTLIKEGRIPIHWEKVTLPHTPRIEPLLVNDQWQGICYYAKKFELSPNSKSKKLFIHFEAAMNVADVWVNGKHLRKHLGGYLPFVVDISSVAHFDKPNIIVVRLNNEDNTITGPKPLYRLDFNTYGGLYRNVWFIEKPLIHITDPIYANKVAGGGIFIHTDNVNPGSAMVHVKTHIKNESHKSLPITIRHTLLDEKKRSVQSWSGGLTLENGTHTEHESSTVVSHPQLWSPATPHLYYLRTELLVNHMVVDAEETRLGIREIVIKPEGLWLNGEKTFLRGVNRHQEYPYVGYALSDNAQRRDAWLIKKAGFDYVRASHYPVSPAFLDACDEYGILVLEPILGWQYFGDFKFEEHARISSREMIRRDRNHPCILAWELSINEIKMPEKFIDEMVGIGHEEYPYQTYIAGWMKEGYEIYIEARQHRKEALLTKPLIVSEYGDWEYYAMNAGFEQDKWNDMLQEERSSRQARGAGEKRLLQQATNIQEAHNDNYTTHAFADGYWVMFDYNRGYVDDLELSGLMDIFRLPKFAYYFYQSQKGYDPANKFAEPMVYIASYWQPSVSEKVRIFSNCEEVELWVDGKSKGKQKPDRNKQSIHLPHPPFTFNVSCKEAGELRAVGYIKGKKAASYMIATPGTAHQIRIWFEESGTPARAGCNDLIFVHAAICDKNGNILSGYNEPVLFSLEGDAEIIQDNYPKAEAGIASILLKIGDHPGKIEISATGKGLINGKANFIIEEE